MNPLDPSTWTDVRNGWQLAALVAILGYQYLQNRSLNRNVGKVKSLINGRLDQLLADTATKSHAEGKLAGAAEVHERYRLQLGLANPFATPDPDKSPDARAPLGTPGHGQSTA
jgi:hypothetical protein